MRFADRVAIITGAGGGIGSATALLLAREGARIVAVDVDPGSASAIADRITASGGLCLAVPADVLDAEAVNRLVELVVQRFGRIDILVNTVGGSTVVANSGAGIDEMDLDEWERVLALNLRGTYLCIHSVVPHMKRQGAGRIVNLSSIVGRGDNARTTAAYSLCKAGIRAMTRKLAIELGPFGITCNATAPGVTLTDRIRERILSKRTEAERLAMIGEVPLRRFATPEDQARVIAFLASEDAAFVSGQTIEVTGGQ